MTSTPDSFSPPQRSGSWLAAALLLFCVTMAGVAGYAVHDARSDRRTEALAALELNARETAVEYAALIAAGRDMLKALAQVEDVRSGQPGGCSDVLHRVDQQYERFISFTRVNAYGHIICSSSQLNAAGRDVSGAEHFKNAVRTRHFALSSFTTDPVTGKPVIVFSLPILDAGGRVLGTVNAGLDMDWLLSQLTALQLTHDVEAVVFDRSGRVLTAFAQSGEGGPSMGRTTLGELVFKHHNGAREYRAGPGRMVLAGFASLEEAPGGLYIVFIQDTDAALAGAWRDALPMVSVAAISLLLAMLLAWLARPRREE